MEVDFPVRAPRPRHWRSAWAGPQGLHGVCPQLPGDQSDSADADCGYEPILGRVLLLCNICALLFSKSLLLREQRQPPSQQPTRKNDPNGTWSLIQITQRTMMKMVLGSRKKKTSHRGKQLAWLRPSECYNWRKVMSLLPSDPAKNPYLTFQWAAPPPWKCDRLDELLN